MSIGLMLDPEQFDTPFEPHEGDRYEAMTLHGVAIKIIVLLITSLVTATIGWRSVHFELTKVTINYEARVVQHANISPLFWVAIFVMLICPIVAQGSLAATKFLGPIFSIAAGFSLGAVSKLYENRYHGVVMLAIMMTVAIFAGVFSLFYARVLTVTKSGMSILRPAMVCVVIILVTDLIFAATQNVSLLDDTGLLGIVISVVISGFAIVVLLVDFQTIDKALLNNYPRKYEWFCAMGVFITIAWIYIRMLRTIGRIMRLGRR